jgi:hypothetical protein
MVLGWQQLGWFAAADPVSLCDLRMGGKKHVMVAGNTTQDGTTRRVGSTVIVDDNGPLPLLQQAKVLSIQAHTTFIPTHSFLTHTFPPLAPPLPPPQNTDCRLVTSVRVSLWW